MSFHAKSNDLPRQAQDQRKELRKAVIYQDRLGRNF